MIARQKPGRAASGESSIHQDQAGRWHGYVSMGAGSGGKHDRRHVSGRTRAAVVGKVRQLEQRRDAGVVLSPGRLTMETWLSHYLEHIAPRRCRDTTLTGYEVVIRRHINPRIGRRPVDRLQPEHLEQLYDDLLADGLSPAYVLLCHRVISRALRIATKRGKVARNVAQLVDPPAVRRPEIVPFSVDQARRLLVAARDARNPARWSVALSLGLRQGEALGLLWSGVDLDRGLLTVSEQLRRQRSEHGCGDPIPPTDPRDRPTWPCGRKRGADCPQRRGGGLVRMPPKSDRSRRTIALPAQLVDELRDHQAGQAVEREYAGPLWEEHGLVFAQVTGRPVDPRRDWRDWKALLARAEVPDARVHDARHTAATLLLAQGVSERVVQEILGHSTIKMTQHYTHVLPEVARDAADRMGRVLWD